MSILTGGDLTDRPVNRVEEQTPQIDAAEALRRRVKQLTPGQCLEGICKNGSIAKSDFVFAVATHSLNEPTLIAGRAGRQVNLYEPATHQLSYQPAPEDPIQGQRDVLYGNFK